MVVLFALHFKLSWLSDMKWPSFLMSFFHWQVLGKVRIEEERKRGVSAPQELRAAFLFLGHLANVPSSCLYFVYVFLCEAGKRWNDHPREGKSKDGQCEEVGWRSVSEQGHRLAGKPAPSGGWGCLRQN